MAIADTIAEVYSKKILSLLTKRLVAEKVANTDYQGEIVNLGDSVRILSESEVVVSDYVIGTPTTTGSVNPTHQVLNIDTAKYVSFAVEDIHALQSSMSLMSAHAQRAAYNLADVLDQDLMTAATNGAGTELDDGAGGAITLGTDGSGIRGVFSEAARTLDLANVATNGRYAICPPEVIEALRLISVVREASDNSFENAPAGKFFGFDVYASNNTVEDAGVSKHCLFGVAGQGVTMARQLSKSEIVRQNDAFADQFRALMLYGIKVTRPAELVSAKVDVNPLV